MKLKVKFLQFSAGRPVIILNEKFANSHSIHVNDRVYIKNKNKSIVAIVDTTKKILGEKEAILSLETSNFLKVKRGETIEISLAQKPITSNYILKKLEGKKLSQKEIYEIIKNIVNNSLTEVEIAYFISAIYTKGMKFSEIISMIKAIVNTGKKLKLDKKIISDKHSIGGIPGRTTPIIVSICTAAGLTMPKTSSKAITTAAGTADALETICKVDFSVEEIKKIVEKTNGCMVWGGSLNLAPADDKIIQVEKLINLDPKEQLIASIISKKLSVNAKNIIIDIPYGENAKVSKKEAIQLRELFLKIARYFSLNLSCSLYNATQPLGSGIGPSLEMKDVINVLKNPQGTLLEKRALILSSSLLELSKKAKKGEGIVLAKKILDSGEAYNKFKEIIKAQKGNINRIKKFKSKYSYTILSDRRGTIKKIDIKSLNYIARLAGCPLDKAAGIFLHKNLNERIEKREELITIFSENEIELNQAINYYEKIKPLKIK